MEIKFVMKDLDSKITKAEVEPNEGSSGTKKKKNF